jgi:hypothetical protein
VRKGFPIPVANASGRWRKRRKVVSVSDDIRRAVQSRGYYMRRLKELKNARPRSTRSAERDAPSGDIDFDAARGSSFENDKLGVQARESIATQRAARSKQHPRPDDHNVRVRDRA